MSVLKSIKSFFLGLLLLVVALLLLVILSPWGIVEILISMFWKRRFWKGLNALGELVLLIATIVDVIGNVILQVPLNRIFNTPEGYKFGSRFDTISYVLGHGLVHDTLSPAGLKMCKILDKFEKDHCVIAYYSRQKDNI